MRTRHVFGGLLVLLVFAVAVTGCGSVAPAGPGGQDGAVTDGGTGDGGMTDGGTTDGGMTDGGTTDGGTTDGGTTDGGTTDGGTTDGGAGDGGTCTVPAATSTVTATSSCLTLDAGAQAVVAVDLKDAAGNPVTGATVTFATTGDTPTWVEPAVVESPTKAGVYYRTLASPTSGTSTTITADASVCGQAVTLTQTVTVTYAAPVSYAAGGTGGCSPQDGNLRVRVVSAESGQPVSGAFVMVGDAPSATAFTTDYETYLGGGTGNAANTATTDSQGYAYFSDDGPGLDGAKTITAGAANRAYMTLEGIGTSDVVLPLPLTSPQVTTSTLQGTSQPSYVNNTDRNVEVALATPTLGLARFTDFRFGSLFEVDRPVGVGGNTCVGGNRTLQVAGNVEVPNQTVIGCQVQATPPDFTVTVPQGPQVDLASLQGAFPVGTLIGGTSPATILAAMTWEKLGLLTGQSTAQSQTGLTIQLTGTLTATMPVSITGAPTGTLYSLAIGDLDGNNGTGRLILEGLHNVASRTASTTTLTTAPSTGAFAGMRDLAFAIDDMGGGATSAIFDRVTTGRTARRLFQGFFAGANATVSTRTFTWNAVATAQSPADYTLARSVLRRLTPISTYRNQAEPFWIVYAPPGTGNRSFTLPTLPSSAPRGASGGYLVPDATRNQSNQWHLGLMYLGLAPSTVDLAHYRFGTALAQVTQLSSDDVTLP